MPDWLKILSGNADGRRQACVALESTVIAHGLPYPHNVQMALRLEEIVREPGRCAGDDRHHPGRIDRRAGSGRRSSTWRRRRACVRSAGATCRLCVAQKLDGATTVATTAWIAHQAGIQVFATGGIGGVHRAGRSQRLQDRGRQQASRRRGFPAS